MCINKPSQYKEEIQYFSLSVSAYITSVCMNNIKLAN